MKGGGLDAKSNATPEQSAAARPASPIDEELFHLSTEEIVMVRDGLLIGLEALGEVERLKEEFEFFMSLGRPVPDELRVIHPTGGADALVRMACALRTIGPGQ